MSNKIKIVFLSLFLSILSFHLSYAERPGGFTAPVEMYSPLTYYPVDRWSHPGVSSNLKEITREVDSYFGNRRIRNGRRYLR